MENPQNYLQLSDIVVSEKGSVLHKPMYTPSAGRYTEYIVIPRYYLCTVLIPADFFLYRDIVISRYSLRFDRYFK